MKSILYINNDAIQLAVGVLKKGVPILKSSSKIQLEKGTVVNGVIFKEQEILSKLGQLTVEGPLTLLLDSSNIAVRRVDVPKMSEKQLLGVVRSEFNYADETDELLFGADLLQNHKNSLICCAAPRSMVTAYLDLLAEAGIQVHRVDVYLNALIKYLDLTQGGGTYVYNVLTGENLVSVLFENGQFVIANRNRIMQEPGTAEFHSELYAKLSSMMQFSQAKKSQYTIETSYYAGLSLEDVAGVQARGAAYGAEIAILSSSPFPNIEGDSDIGVALLENKQDIELKSAMSVRTQEKKVGGKGVAYGALLGCVCIIGGIYGYYALSNGKIDREIAGIKTYLAEQSQAVATVTENTQRQGKMVEHNTILATAQATCDYGKAIESTTISSIYDQATQVQIVGVDINYLTGEVKVAGECAGVLSISDFVEKLDKTGKYESLDYNGYQLPDTRYAFTVSGTLKAGA